MSDISLECKGFPTLSRRHTLTADRSKYFKYETTFFGQISSGLLSSRQFGLLSLQ